jgi:hypothetical protein
VETDRGAASERLNQILDEKFDEYVEGICGGAPLCRRQISSA